MTGINPRLQYSVPVGTMEWATGPAAEIILADLAQPDINRELVERILAPVPPRFRTGAAPINLQAYPLSGAYQHHIREFQTAYENIGKFLKEPNQALEYEASGQARTTLFFDSAADRLAAYASLKCSSLRVQADALHATVLPAVELIMLCVDDRYRRKGVGEAALSYLIRGLYGMKKAVGVRLITLFSVKDAVDFYRRKFGFGELSQGMQLFLTPEYSTCVPMYLALPRENVLSSATKRKPSLSTGPFRCSYFKTAGFTQVIGGWPFNTLTIFSAAIFPILMRVSGVAEAMWGTITTLSSSAKPGASSGSFSKTSSPAPQIHFSFSAFTRAFSSTTGPRLALMRTAVGFIICSSFSPM